VVTARTKRLAFRFETKLEDYLLVQLSLLLSRQGKDLLIIGRQVRSLGRRIDLLAIDAAGVIYIIELKLKEASPSIIAQVLAYRRGIKGLNRQEVIRLVADGPLHINLTNAFQRHFGRPLPEAVNESQVLMIIAASIPRITAHSILDLMDAGFSITTFRYVVESNAVSLIPCCRDDQDVETLHAETLPPALRKRSTARVSHVSPPYGVPIDDSVREFWLTHAYLFTSPIVLFSFVYEQYDEWVRSQTAEGRQLSLCQMGLFGRQLAAIIGESAEWTGVFVPPGIDMNTLTTWTNLPSTRTSINGVNYRIVAYRRNPDYQASAA
jgi:hypothetical protein